MTVQIKRYIKKDQHYYTSVEDLPKGGHTLYCKDGRAILVTPGMKIQIANAVWKYEGGNKTDSYWWVGGWKLMGADNESE